MFDEKEYLNIYNKYYNKIYKYCLSELDTVSAEECANNVMIDLYKKWDKIEKGEKIGHWILRAARISLLNKKTSLAKEREALLQINIKEFDRILAHASEEDYQFFNLDTELFNIAEQLPAELRLIFVLKFIDKLTVSEVAERLDMPYSSTRFKLNKAMEAAKAIIDKNYL